MTKNRSYRHSHLFTVRLWSDDAHAGPKEWRGQVRHVFSGETRYFCDWSTLIAHLQTLLSECESDTHPTDTDD